MSNKKKILICDDEEGIRESLRLILEDDYEVRSASKGSEAIEKIRNEHIDLAILDIKMPKMSGLETSKNIKKISPKTKIIMASAYKSVEAVKEALKSGASDYIVKPFESEEVLKKVSATI